MKGGESRRRGSPFSVMRGHMRGDLPGGVFCRRKAVIRARSSGIVKGNEMKKGEIYQGTVAKVQFPNKGIVEADDGGQAVVKHVIPGQRVSFLVNKARSGRAEGRLVEVLERSPLELLGEACPHFGICGGCAYLTMPMEEQLRLKGQQVRELLAPACEPYGSFDEVFEGIKESPRQFGYRNKMEFSFGDSVKGGPLALGMHRRGSFHDIVTVAGCRIMDGDYSRILEGTLQYFAAQGTDFYHKNTHRGYLRHLLARKAAKTGEILIDLVTANWNAGVVGGAGMTMEAERELLQGMREMLLALHLDGVIVGILHTVNDSVADAVIDQGTEILYGQDYFYEELLGLRFKISAFSFFQTNSLGAEVLYQTVREYVAGAGDGKVVYDLYSGTGTIAQILAPVARKVIGVELVEAAVEAARENAERNGLHNCEFFAGDVLKALDGIQEKPDFIVLDPPRDGINPKALKKIIGYGVERMVYVSCKPTSLARDLVELMRAGYRVERGGCVDMFPGTCGIETVVLLSQLQPDDYIDVELDLDELDVTAAEQAATYQEIKDYIMERHGVKVHTAYIAQVKRKYGLDMRKNYRPSKSDDYVARQCMEEKEAYIKEALEHFAMIRRKSG